MSNTVMGQWGPTEMRLKSNFWQFQAVTSKESLLPHICPERIERIERIERQENLDRAKERVQSFLERERLFGAALSFLCDMVTGGLRSAFRELRKQRTFCGAGFCSPTKWLGACFGP